ncbi:methionyl-tRNA formyltransferase [uncultured Aquimarina sp.]|uniref:methionyl-tRNA formyltransferase n=1 Tax=uncultured Aquimarina sp. TaxID=575652 RepID=UPI002622E347|nr:methionyl-tRNA formyltransferase [uncultured Aquimarina sp.]
MLKLGILCSGGLGYKTLQKICKRYIVAFVLTDKKSGQIIEFCEINKIPYYAGNPRNGKGFDFIKNINIDVIISVNYLFLIEEDIILHPKKLIFNVHGSLLPKYRGRTPHVWAIINNEKEAGITAHKIDVGCDTGAIIDQTIVPIEENDTGATILSKYADQYFPLIKKVLVKLENGSIEFKQQDDSKATYFGKRVPEDGEINWNWQKERIRNWVRAQADPYPGAFTFYEGVKVIIDKISYSDIGFEYQDENGTIIRSDYKLVVKTPNGAVELEDVRTDNIIFIKGKKLGNENRK